MKSLFTKILSVKLAFLVLFATSSFSVDKHFCCDELVSVSFFGKANDCEKLSKVKDCEDSFKESNNSEKLCSSQDKGCCSDETIIKKSDKSKITTKLKLENEIITFSSLFYYTYINLFKHLEQLVVPFKNYRVPLISKDIHVLNETFLI